MRPKNDVQLATLQRLHTQLLQMQRELEQMGASALAAKIIAAKVQIAQAIKPGHAEYV